MNTVTAVSTSVKSATPATILLSDANFAEWKRQAAADAFRDEPTDAEWDAMALEAEQRDLAESGRLPL